MDTIIALSSGALPSGVAIIRVSGPKSQFFLEQIVQDVVPARMAKLVSIKDVDESVVDQGLALWFPAPNSFTGEDVLELQVHGSRAVVAKILGMATLISGIRIAEPGEFARRAFANGKIDLTEAEGLADLIEAETEAQRKVAQYLASGGLRDLYASWQNELLDARALIEADIDFADEDDVPGSVADRVWGEIDSLANRIKLHLDSYDRAERIRDGFRISLIGPPNAGKSSLLNALAGSDRAIVSTEAGTTRDVVEVRLDLGGFLVLLSDTAGLRKGAGEVEAEGIRRSLETARGSDLILLLSDDGNWPALDFEHDVHILKVATKRDIAGDILGASIGVSVKNAEMFDAFFKHLSQVISEKLSGTLTSNALRLRYIEHLKECVRHLNGSLESATDLELRAEHLRAAAYSLGFITGQHNVEDVLGRIFSSFCIGK